MNIISKENGGGSVEIEKEDAVEVILWLTSFQQSVQPTHTREDSRVFLLDIFIILCYHRCISFHKTVTNKDILIVKG